MGHAYRHPLTTGTQRVLDVRGDAELGSGVLVAAAGFGPCQRVDATLTVTTSDGPGLIVGFLENAPVRSRALVKSRGMVYEFVGCDGLLVNLR